MDKRVLMREAVACHYCGFKLSFADVLVLTPDLLIMDCPCRPKESPIRSQRSVDPERHAAVVRTILGRWRPALPYVAADMPPLPCEDIDPEAGLMTLAMLTVDNVPAFLNRCHRDAKS